MLLKGYKKNLVVFKHLGSDYVEEAYLILKPELPAGMGQSDIVKEATRLVHAYESGQKQKRMPFSFPSFFIGMLSTCGFFLLLWLILG